VKLHLEVTCVTFTESYSTRYGHMRNYNNNNTIIKCLLTRKTAAQRLRRAQWLCALRSAHLRGYEQERFSATSSSMR